MIARSQEESYDGSRDELMAIHFAPMAMVGDGHDSEGQRHANEIESKWCRVCEGVFDEDESRSPDEDGKEQ